MKLLQTKIVCMKNKDLTLDEVDCIPSEQYPNGPHYGYHDFFEMELYLSGKGVHYLNAVPYEVSRGTVYFLSPGDFHRYELLPEERMHMFNLKIAQKKIPQRVQEAIGSAKHPSVGRLDTERLLQLEGELRYLLRLLGESPPDTALCENVLERVLLLVLRSLESPIYKMPSPVENTVVQRAVAYLNAHYGKDVSQEALAAHLGMSTNYLGAYFKRHTGVSVRDYLLRVRLHHGAQLLKSTRMKIMEIASSTGFGSAEYFTKRFRESFGMTPKQYRDSLC